MIPQKNFDYSRIINELEITDMKIDMKSRNIRNIKNTINACFIAGIIIGLIVFVCSFIAVIFADKEQFFLNILRSLGASLTFAILIFLSTYFDLSKTMDFSILKKIKQYSTKNHSIYKYKLDIKSIYTKRIVPVPPSGVGTPTEQDRQKYGMSAGIVLIVDNQNVYLTQNTYDEIAFDKEVILYIVKCDNNYVLYDYEKVANN